MQAAIFITCALLAASCVVDAATPCATMATKGTAAMSTMQLASTNATAPPAANATEPPSLVQAVALAPKYNLSILIKAVEAANLTAPLASPNTEWTIFAPLDSAFFSLLSSLNTSASALLADKPLLVKVLSLHVVPGVAAKAASLKDGQTLPTLLPGANLTVAKSAAGVKVYKAAAANATTPAPAAANVVVPDIAAGKSIIHVIDRVLLP